MTETPHQPCPYTACGSSDAFSWNAELQVGKCHSCSRGYPSKDEMFPWAKSTYPYKDKSHKREPASVTYEGVRGIAPDVAKLYGIQMQLDADGDPLQYAFKYKNNIKYRDMTLPDQKGKKIWMKDKGKKILDLFGPEFNSGSSKRLYLTEGEFDAASLYQILGKTYPVLSLPSSSISDDFIKHCHDKLDSFQELVYAGELDHAGKGAIERLYRAYAKKLYFVPMTKHKDANAFLMANDSDELKWAALKPQRYSPDNFFCSESEFLKILREENPYEAVPTGHSSLDYMIRGMVKGGLTFVKAPPGTGKCLHPDQEVLLIGGEPVKAREVRVGDSLIGDDGTPRQVLSVSRGKEMMYRIVPTKGDSWICNESHILSLVNSDTGNIVDVSVKDWLNKSDNFRVRHKQYRVGVEKFHSYLPVDYDAYFVGVYLGDGHKHRSAISLGPKKQKVLEYCEEVLSSYGLETSRENKGSYTELTFKRCLNKNDIWSSLIPRLFDSQGMRQIPYEYKTSGMKHRRALLAGLLDTDGYYASGVFEWTTQSKHLCDDFLFVARSLGLAAYWSEKIVKEKTYYRVNLSGDFSEFHFLRHEIKTRKQMKDVLRTGITIEPVGEGEYCGFEIDGNKRFLLGDFTVTHNTEIIRYFERAMLDADDVKIALIHMEEQKSTTLRAMATYELGVNVRTKDDQQENGVSDADVEAATLKSTKGDRTIIFEMRAHDSPLEIVEYCRLAAGVYGAQFIFVDHVQRLTYIAGPENATNVLTQVAANLAQLAKEFNIGIILISHVNEEGRTKYASSLEEEAIITISISRDKSSDNELERNVTDFEVTKNRPFSRLGSAGKVFFDSKTTILEEYTFDSDSLAGGDDED